MEVVQVLRMNAGDGETSYAKNSEVQNKIISITKPTTDDALVSMLRNQVPETIGIADLGCSSGPNTLCVISEIIKIIRDTYRDLNHPCPELNIFLNDLPNNDFNYIFALLPDFYSKLKKEKGIGNESCFISGMSGSFYGRLFPKRSLHFVHSSSSLHWLSQVPCGLESSTRPHLNKGKIYISESSPKEVIDGYARQFQNDFGVFLESRSQEIVGGGRMVLSFMGRSSIDFTTQESCYQWELLAQALMSLAKEGNIDEEKIDSFNAPYYAPCPEEIKSEIKKEGSFVVDRIEAFEIDWDGSDNQEKYDKTKNHYSRGRKVAMTIRAVVESMIESHFGSNIIDELFQKYEKLVDDHLSKGQSKYVNLVISLIRND